MRNSASTIGSQLLDTILVITILSWDDPKVTNDAMYVMIRDRWIFEMLCALADTPLAHGAVWLFRRHLVQRTVEDSAADPFE